MKPVANTANTKIPTAAQILMPYLLLMLAVLIVYANVYDNAFLFDDELIITHNELLTGWGNFTKLLTASTTEGAHIAGGFYRPVQLILYFFINQIAGQSTLAYHLLNIAFHMANACLMYTLGRRLNFNPIGVFLGALIWAVHPIHTEAVTYMSGTGDVLYGFFCLLGCVVILPDASPRRVAWALPILMIGVLGKETIAVLPALAVICLFVKNPDRLRNWKVYVRTWPLWIVSLVYMYWRTSNDHYDGPARYEHLYALKDFANLELYAHHFWYRLDTFLATLPAYASILMYPVGLHMERSFTIYTVMNAVPVLIGLAIFLVALAQIVWGHGQRGLAFTWGLLWFAGAHFPDSGLLVPSNSLFLEHWMYVPSIGLILGITETVSVYLCKAKLQKVSLALSGLCILIAAVFGTMTLQQNEVWHDPITFYANILNRGEPSARVHNNLALAYSESDRLPEALEEYRKAIAITDTYAETRHNYALTLLRLPDPDSHVQEAIDNLNRALEIDPNFYRSYEALSIIYEHKGDHAKAAEYMAQFKEAKTKVNAQ
jgi:tetratricopeptide (TPR) repeat protein